jgi:hypothetical protein
MFFPVHGGVFGSTLFARVDTVEGGTMLRWLFHGVRGIGLTGALLGVGLWLFATQARAEEVIFLQDGRTITADKTEVIGDHLRITKPTEILDVPRDHVLTIHEVSPPTASPGATPPAEVYQDMTGQMNDKVRQDTKQLLTPPRVFPH